MYWHRLACGRDQYMTVNGFIDKKHLLDSGPNKNLIEDIFLGVASSHLGHLKTKIQFNIWWN